MNYPYCERYCVNPGTRVDLAAIDPNGTGEYASKKQARSILKQLREELIGLQEIVRSIPISDDVVMYAARLVNATRPHKSPDQPKLDAVQKYVTYGASPRAGQALVLAGKARAVLDGRYHVDFDDIKKLAYPVLRHRLVLNFHGRADNVDADDVITALLAGVKEES